MNKRQKKKFVQKCRRKKYPSKHNRRILREIAKSINDLTRKYTYDFTECDSYSDMLHRFQEAYEDYMENMVDREMEVSVDIELQSMEDLLNGK